MSMLNGAMAGLGGSMQTVGKTLMDADIDRAKQERLAKIQQDSQGREFAQRDKEAALKVSADEKRTRMEIEAENNRVHSTTDAVDESGNSKKMALTRDGKTIELGGSTPKDSTGSGGGSVPKGTRANPIEATYDETVTDAYGQQKVIKVPIRTFIEGEFEYQEKYDPDTGKWITSQKIPVGKETKPQKNPIDAVASDIITGGNSSGQFSGKGLLKPKAAEPASAGKPDAVVLKGHAKYGDVTEADIQETMKATGMSREQVLNKLNGK